jgi:aspartate kinase
MKVYKFGGASVRNADGVRNLAHIVEGEENLFIIVSAMGKTTNALERVFTHMQNGRKEEANEEIKQVQAYHAEIIDNLWGEPTNINEVTLLFGQLRNIVNDIVYRSADAELWYDTIVAYGELISTTIISKYLNHINIRNRWIDMRTTLLTNQRHKDANVDIRASKHRLRASIENTGVGVFVGQGFIGGAPDGTTTTLGREGSDYSAAVVANILGAESMSVWKDVEGVLNADPKIFNDAVTIVAKEVILFQFFGLKEKRVNDIVLSLHLRTRGSPRLLGSGLHLEIKGNGFHHLTHGTVSEDHSGHAIGIGKL